MRNYTELTVLSIAAADNEDLSFFCRYGLGGMLDCLPANLSQQKSLKRDRFFHRLATGRVVSFTRAHWQVK